MIKDANGSEDTETEFGAVSETWKAAASPTWAVGDQKTVLVLTSGHLITFQSVRRSGKFTHIRASPLLVLEQMAHRGNSAWYSGISLAPFVKTAFQHSLPQARRSNPSPKYRHRLYLNHLQ
jgi:hypothetical protein